MANSKRRHRERTRTPSSDEQLPLSPSHNSDVADFPEPEQPLTHTRQRKKKRQKRVVESAVKHGATTRSTTNLQGTGITKFAAMMSTQQMVNSAIHESVQGMKQKGKVKAKQKENMRLSVAVSFQ